MRFRYSNALSIIWVMEPLITGPSYKLFGLFNRPSGKYTTSTCVRLKNLLGSSLNIIAATFLSIRFSLGPTYKSICSKILSRGFVYNSFASLLPTFTKYSRNNSVEISSILMSGFPRSSNGTRLANSRSSSRTSPLAIILLVPLRT